MRSVTFTSYSDVRVKIGKSTSFSWLEWVDIFSSHDVRGDPSDSDDRAALEKHKLGPAVLLGTLVRHGAHRRASTVKEVHALALDLDSRPETVVLELLERLKPYEWVAYSTHKHGSEVADGKPRLRVIFPLAEPVPAAEYPEVWQRFDLFTDHLNDPQTKDVCRLHFLPSTFDPSLAETHHNAGRWLSVDDLPSLPPSPSPPTSGRPEPPQTPRDIQDETIYIDDILTILYNRARVIPRTRADKPAISALFDGVPFAQPGERHNTVLSLTAWIAKIHPEIERLGIEHVFRRSLEAMAKEHADPPTMDEVWTAYRGAVEKLSSLPTSDVNQSYTKDDLERIATGQGCTVEELDNRWTLQHGGVAWYLAEDGQYYGPFTRDDHALAMATYLRRAPVRLTETSQKGFRYRSQTEIARDHGDLILKVSSDLTIQRSIWEPRTRTFREAVCPIRHLKPYFDERLDEYLKVATQGLYSKIVDWFSVCPDVSRILCALYLDGPKSAGKTMIAYGLSKLWTTANPAELQSVLASFNDELVRCPLILADEEIPQYYHQKVPAQLRSMLSTTSRTLKRKYLPTTSLIGAPRLILTANNEFLLQTKDVHTPEDLEAIAQRFLYVPFHVSAAEFLEEVPQEVKDRWWARGIAEHALYLREHHVIESPGKRFAVEGDISNMHRLLIIGSKWNALVIEFLVRFMMEPAAFLAKNTGLIRIHDGELLVNDQGIIDGWELYLRTRQECDTGKVGAALRSVSKYRKTKQLRWQHRRIRYRVIDIDHLLLWSDYSNIGDKDAMLARLRGDLEPGENVIDFPGKDQEAPDGKDDDGAIEY